MQQGERVNCTPTPCAGCCGYTWPRWRMRMPEGYDHWYCGGCEKMLTQREKFVQEWAADLQKWFGDGQVFNVAMFKRAAKFHYWSEAHAHLRRLWKVDLITYHNRMGTNGNGAYCFTVKEA